jgi:hypothetical protein
MLSFSKEYDVGKTAKQAEHWLRFVYITVFFDLLAWMP